MKIKRMLKLTLPALLLAASASAYAADAQTGAVKLKNGTTVTWAKFVEAINDPSTLGNITVSEEIVNRWNETKEAFKNASEKVTEAKNAVEEKTTALNTARTALNSVRAALKGLPEATNTAKEAYETENGNLIQWQAQRTTLQGEVDELKKSTTKAPKDWLEKALTAAGKFKNDYKKSVTTATVNFYYNYDYNKEDEYGILKLSFDESHKSEAGWNPTNGVSLYEIIITDKSDIQIVDEIYVDCGKDENGQPNYLTNDGLLSVSVPTRMNSLASAVYTAIEALVNNSNYQKDVNPNQDDIDKKQKTIDELTASISALTTVGKNNGGNADETELQRLFRVWKDAESAENAARTAISDAEPKVTTAETELSKANQTLTTANDDLATAKQDLDDAQKAYDDEVAKKAGEAIAPYQDVQLTADVTAAATISSYAGRIQGNGHVITLASGLDSDCVFDNFSGTLIDAAVNAIGGKFANALSTPTFNRVAYWTGTTGAYYDESGKRSAANTLGELGFAAREDFGANFAANALVDLDDYSKVYNITVYEQPNSNVQRYVHKNSGSDGDFVLVDGTPYSIPANRFAKSETADLKDVANVYYNGQSEKVVITDKEAFYAPVDIYAATVVYNRQFNDNMNAVCLPFDLSSEDSNKIKALCKYNKETFDKFWFTIVEEPIAAHTPFLLVADGSFSLPELHNLTIKKTPADQVVMYEGNVDDPSKSYGLLKKAKRNEITDNKTQDGDQFGYKVYGLKTDGHTFQAASDKSVFSAFRTVIYSELATSKNTEAIRAIGILDEKGVEITDELAGIDSPAVDGAAFDIATGQGEIIITSDADYGKVAIYSIDGKVAATADVKAGTTTVNVAGGIYVVMGKKVMVK